jgi:hypothetical protein
MAGIAVAELTDEPPQVGITVDGLDAAAESVITVEVSWDGGVVWHAVQEATEVGVLEETFIRDFIPPLNVEATYRLVVVSGATTPATLTDTVTVTSTSGWIQDPLDPRSAVQITASVDDGDVMLTGDALSSATWAQPADLVTPQGADLPVASIGRRVLAGQVPLTVSHAVAAEGGALRRLLLSSGCLVVRGLSEDLLDAVAHVQVGSLNESRVGRPDHRVSTWDLVATQVRATTLSIVVPWWTYDQVKALWVAWAAAEGETADYDTVASERSGSSYADMLAQPGPI